MTSENWISVTATLNIIKKFFFALLFTISIYSILVFWGALYEIYPELQSAATIFVLGIYFCLIMILLFHIVAMITRLITKVQYKKELEVVNDKPKRKTK